MNSKYPDTLEQVESEFQKFMESYGKSRNIFWINNKTICWANDSLYYLNSDISHEIRKKYLREKTRYGVSVNGMAFDEENILVTLEVPENQKDAEYRNISETSLKCSILNKPMVAIKLDSRFSLLYLKLINLKANIRFKKTYFT